jgi:hypothetical protein
MNTGYWNRPPRAERYRPSNPAMERAFANLTGKTSASLGDLIALAGLGAEVVIDTSQAASPLRVMPDGSMRVLAE